MELHRLALSAIAGTTLAAAMPATAQDVVVMRRSIAPPSAQLRPEWTALEDWTWISQAPSCGKGQQRRTVTCRSLDHDVDPARCDPRTKPNDTREDSSYAGCDYRYVYGAPGDWSSTCDARATRAVPTTCLRSDGTQLDASACPASAGTPQDTQTGAVTTGCGYEWRGSGFAWTSVCSASATYQQNVTCNRIKAAANDAAGSWPAGGVADEDMCLSYAVGQRPATVQGATGNYEGCTGSWSAVTWNDVGVCTGGEKEQTSSYSCSSGDKCDPRLDPKPAQRRTVKCATTKVTCTGFALATRAKVSGPGETGYGDTYDTFDQAKAFCENYSVKVIGCNITRQPTGKYVVSADVGTSVSITSYPSQTGYTDQGGTCRP